jgi:tetratricopeptide (TPR) repeat protein
MIFKLTTLSAVAVDAGLHRVDAYRHILVIIKTIGYYLSLLLFPVRLNVEHHFITPLSFFEPAVIFSLIGISLAVIAIVITFKRLKLASFGLMWVFVALLPVSNIIYLFNRPIAEQRLYIPSVGFCLALSGLLTGISHVSSGKGKAGARAKVFCVLCIILISAFYMHKTLNRNLDWVDPVRFWEKTLELSPDKSRVYSNLGYAYLRKGRIEEAISAFNKVLQLRPGMMYPHKGLGEAYCLSGQYSEAVKHYEKVLEMNPGDSGAYINLGVAYQSLGMADDAIAMFKEAIRIDSQNPITYQNLGMVYEEILHDHEKAVSFYKKAIDLNCKAPEVYFNLGVAYSSMKMLDEAIDSYRKAVQVDPNFAAAYGNIAVTYYWQGKYALARQYAQKAKRLGFAKEDLFKALEEI